MHIDVKKLYRLIFVIVLAGLIIGGVVSYFLTKRSIMNSLEQNQVNNQALNQENNVAQAAEEIKKLTNSPVGEVTRAYFDFITSTSSKGVQEILTKPPFIKVSDNINSDVLKSKFVLVNGNSIPVVGAQAFVLFPQYPEHVYRVSYQMTTSTTTPLVMVRFEKSEDTKENIDKLLTALQPYLNEAGFMK